MTGGDMNTMKKCSTCGNLYAGDLCPKCMAGFAQKPTDPTAPPDELPLRPGQAFHGLEILELLGRGGMGVVYKARQPALDRLVALKILPQKMALDPDFQNRFIREAKALGSLSHPNIVAVYDFGAEGGFFFFAMEFVDGTNLRQILRDRKLTPEQGLKIVPQLCDALEYAHGEGIVHRDIKPENILLDKKGRVKIADFGLAKLIGADARANLTMTNMVMGTPHYMAPEQVENPKGVDHRADIYAIGVVLYEMLTGELPIGRFEMPSKMVQIDVRLDEVVLRALEKSPEKRYQAAGDVKDAVTKATSVKAPDSYSPTVITPKPAKRSGNRAMLAMAGVTAAAVIVALLPLLKSPPAAAPKGDPVSMAPPAPQPVDLVKLFFGPEERPGHYVYQKTGAGLPSNPLLAKDYPEMNDLLANLRSIGLLNIDRSEVRKGYLAAWWGWSAAFVALDTPIAERIEKNFQDLAKLENKWFHRKGDLLVLAWSPRRENRALLTDLVGMLQKKLELPVEPPPISPELLRASASDLPSKWKPWLLSEWGPGVSAPKGKPVPGTRAGFEQNLAPDEKVSGVLLQVCQFERKKDAEAYAPAENAKAELEVIRTGDVVAALYRSTDDFYAYEKIAEEIRQWMGYPRRTFEQIVINPRQVPNGYSIDKVETAVPAVLKTLGLADVPASDIPRAWRATFKPAGAIAVLETNESVDRSGITQRLKNRGASWYQNGFVFGIEGTEDETLDALENRIREKFGWERNRPRSIHVINARLTPGDLPPGFTLADEKVDRRTFSCTLRGPSASLTVRVEETHDYGLLEKARQGLPYKPGDVLLVKDTVVAYIGGPEEAWPVLNQLEATLRKKMRMGGLTADELGIHSWELKDGRVYLDRKDKGRSPNPSLVENESGEVAAIWTGFVDPSETLVTIHELRDRSRDAAFAAALKEGNKTPGSFAVVYKDGVVITVKQEKPDDGTFAAISEVIRAKLRLPK
ncbi:MAG TPA: serine/threonine-protein kinase [Planctomycetota bacterium]|nr:serine/threonine-protein kinase [Planctomycetota bacterium]